MAGEFAVKINAREGTAEVSGSDKEWVSDQIEKLEALLRQGGSNGNETSAGADSSKSTPKEDGGEATRGRLAGKQPRGSRGGSRPRRAVNAELNSTLTADVTDKLQAYVDERESKFKRNTDQAAIIATFLQDEIDWPTVSADDLHTVYSRMGWRTPNTRAALQNGRTRDGYFGPQEGGRFPLTRNGENFGRHDSKPSS